MGPILARLLVLEDGPEDGPGRQGRGSPRAPAGEACPEFTAVSPQNPQNAALWDAA